MVAARSVDDLEEPRGAHAAADAHRDLRAARRRRGARKLNTKKEGKAGKPSETS
jgi:hypothetical protein